MATLKKSLVLTKIVSGFKKPDTGRTVTMRDTSGAVLATATETPAGSGIYVCNYTTSNKYAYWYVDGVLKDSYSNNSPFWAGNYNEISASSATISSLTAPFISNDLIQTETVETDIIYANSVQVSGDSDLSLTAWSDGTEILLSEYSITANKPFYITGEVKASNMIQYVYNPTQTSDSATVPAVTLGNEQQWELTNTGSIDLIRTFYVHKTGNTTMRLLSDISNTGGISPTYVTLVVGHLSGSTSTTETSLTAVSVGVDITSLTNNTKYEVLVKPRVDGDTGYLRRPIIFTESSL